MAARARSLHASVKEPLGDGLVSHDGKIDGRCSKSLSKESFRSMPRELREALDSDRGDFMFKRIYAVLKYYCGDDVRDFILVEQFNLLHARHYEPLYYMKQFGVHQNELFANLQEFVRIEFDVFRSLRIFLRRKKLEKDDIKNHRAHQTKMMKSEQKHMMDEKFAFNEAEEDQLWDNDNPIAKLPEPGPTMIDYTVTEDKDDAKEVMMYKRRKAYELLLLFPCGLMKEQWAKAIGLRYGETGGEFPTYEDVEEYMQDIIQIKEKGDDWHLMRARFDVQDLKIRRKVLNRNNLSEQYLKEQATLLGLQHSRIKKPTKSKNKKLSSKRETKKNEMKIQEDAGAPPKPTALIQPMCFTAPHGPRLRGSVVEFSAESGGYIEWCGANYRVFHSGLVLKQENTLVSLSPGDTVEFEVGENEQGEDECVNVTGRNGVHFSGKPIEEKHEQLQSEPEPESDQLSIKFTPSGSVSSDRDVLVVSDSDFEQMVKAAEHNMDQQESTDDGLVSDQEEPPPSEPSSEEIAPEPTALGVLSPMMREFCEQLATRSNHQILLKELSQFTEDSRALYAEWMQNSDSYKEIVDVELNPLRFHLLKPQLFLNEQ